MTVLKIYADFNGLVAGCRNPERTAVVLDTFGSVRDLANAGIVLHPDLPIIAVDWSDEQEDLEGHGTAQYDPIRNWWVVEFDELGVRYVPAGDRSPVTTFLCTSCRRDLHQLIDARKLSFSDSCPSCGTPLFSPIQSPPSSQTSTT